MRRQSRMATRLATVLMTVMVMALSLAVGVAMVGAEEPIKLGINPVGVEGSYFTLTMSPGESRELTVHLANHGASQVRARTYAADAYTIPNGGFGAKLADEPMSGATTWLSYPNDILELAPGAGIERTFSVTVPADARPGEYLSSVAIQNAEPIPGGGGGIQFNQIVRQVIAVSITVPGPVQRGLEIGAVTHKVVAGQSTLVIALKNTGNIRLKPAGEFVLFTAAGKEISRFPIALDSVYAGTETVIEVPFDQALSPGDYRASLSLTTPDGAAATATALPVTIAREEIAAVPPAAAAPRATVDQEATPAPQAGLPLPLIAGALLGAGLLAGVGLYAGRRMNHRPVQGSGQRGAAAERYPDER